VQRDHLHVEGYAATLRLDDHVSKVDLDLVARTVGALGSRERRPRS
jgi:hypothetical protein